MSRNKAPQSYVDFLADFPELKEAWNHMRAAEKAGPIDDKERRLLKLGIAIGARSEGGTTSAVRKAVAAGASRDEVMQVVALAASTIGLPSAVAARGWVLRGLGEA